MAKVEEGKYKRLKEYPNIPKRVLETGAGVVLALAAFHAMPEIVNSTFLHNIWGVGGVSQFSDWAISGISNGVAALTTHFFPQADIVPNAIVGDPMVHNALHAIHADTAVRANDLVTAETAMVAAGVAGLAKTGLTAVRKAEVVDAPVEGGMELASADKIIATLRGTMKGKALKRYEGLNRTEIAVEVAGIAQDLKKGQIDGSAIWAPAVGELLRPVLPAGLAADVTLRKETFKRLPNNPLHSLILGLADNPITHTLERFPGAGDTMNFIGDVADMAVGALIPKRDIFGKWHHNIGNLGIDIGASAIGDFMGFLPTFTSNDVKEGVEVRARGELKTPEMAERVNDVATIVVGSKVAKSPRRYSVQPR